MTGFSHFKRNELCKDDVALLMKGSFFKLFSNFLTEELSLCLQMPFHFILFSFTICFSKYMSSDNIQFLFWSGGLEITGDLN